MKRLLRLLILIVFISCVKKDKLDMNVFEMRISEAFIYNYNNNEHAHSGSSTIHFKINVYDSAKHSFGVKLHEADNLYLIHKRDTVNLKYRFLPPKNILSFENKNMRVLNIQTETTGLMKLLGKKNIRESVNDFFSDSYLLLNIDGKEYKLDNSYLIHFLEFPSEFINKDE